ncbi:ABC transporter permease [Janibacter cremeus]|uniref:ABC-2 type transport system permease protein n=1 Tax=Janibacter cremeus TaxID=1285192 RepID=A0A852VQY6_9MICO|nr:ABC transporter permease [Janibacter cremeus]NYF98349.1 ABC-2 type transport system permease protein [Janibacter cremeus]
MSRPLSLRVELRRQVTRPRTRWAYVVLIALPLVVVAAFTLGDDDSTGQGFAGLATSGAANFAVFMLLITAQLLILILAALFVGDPVPAEASWASLRYLLIAPVPRVRLLTSKVLVGLGLTALAVLVLLGWVLLVGGVVYGWSPLSLSDGGTLGWGHVLSRLGVAAGYVFIAQLPFAAVAFWMGVRTDAPLAAVGVAVIASIVSSILDALTTLGDYRRALPNHYSQEWIGLFTADPDYAALLPGVLWALLYAVVFIALGYRHFARKDVLS